MNPALIATVKIFRIGTDSYLLRETETNKVFQLDTQTRFLVRLFDGQHTIDEILQSYRERFNHALPLRNLEEFLGQLNDLGMLSQSPVPKSPIPSKKRGLFLASQAENTFYKDLLNYFFELLAILFGWLLHPVCLLPLFFFVVTSLHVVYENWHRVIQTINHFWYAPPIFPLILLPFFTSYFISFVVGAILTALACKQFGGRIEGFFFRMYVGFLPVIYCNVGDSFVLMNQRGKWVLLTLRLWTLLALASCAVMIWKTRPLYSTLGFYSEVMASTCFVEFVIALIVFLPRDGYRILSYLVGDPHLRERAIHEAKAWFGFNRSKEALTDRDRWRLRRFGLGIFATYAILGGIAFGYGGHAVIHAYGGKGAVLVVAIFVWFIYGPTMAMLKKMKISDWLRGYERNFAYRWTIRLLFILGLIVVAFLPYDYEVSGECVLLPTAEFGARAQITGQIDKIHVRENEYVDIGTKLVTLKNPSVAMNPQIIRQQLDYARADLDMKLEGYRRQDILIAKAELDKATKQVEISEIELKRAQHMYERRLGSEEDRDKAKYQLEADQGNFKQAIQEMDKAREGYRRQEVEEARAKMRELEADLAEAEQQAEFLTINSPIPGRIVTPHVTVAEGEYVDTGDLILAVKNEARLLVEIATQEAGGVLVKPGTFANVRLNGLDGELITAHVISVASDIDSWKPLEPFRTDKEKFSSIQANTSAAAERYYRIIAELDGPVSSLQPGMLGYSRVFVREERVWKAFLRPVVRFVQTEVWSWLP